MLVLTLRERDGGVEIESPQGDVLRVQVVEIRGGSVRVGFEDGARRFEITRDKAIVRFPKQPGDDGPKAA
jgi:sRNA-binding carbon storage regulator CsrA